MHLDTMPGPLDQLHHRDGRRHQAWRDDENQVGLVLSIGRAAEQSPKHRNGSKPRHLRKIPFIAALQEPGNREALTVP